MRKFHSLLNEEAKSVLGKGVVNTYRSAGSANPVAVQKEVLAWRKRLKKH